MKDISACIACTDKETDGSWDIFIILKINSGMVLLAGQYCEKKFGAYYEHLLRPLFYVCMGKVRSFK